MEDDTKNDESSEKLSPKKEVFIAELSVQVFNVSDMFAHVLLPALISHKNKHQ